MSFMASKDFNKMQKPLRYINVNSVQTKMWMTECITMDYYNNGKGTWRTCVWSNRCGCAAPTLKTCTYTGGNKSKVNRQNWHIVSNLSRFVDSMSCNSYCQYATHAGCRTQRRKCVRHIPGQAECRPQTVCFSQHRSRPHSHSHTVIPWYICVIWSCQRQLLNARWNTAGVAHTTMICSTISTMNLAFQQCIPNNWRYQGLSSQQQIHWWTSYFWSFLCVLSFSQPCLANKISHV